MITIVPSAPPDRSSPFVQVSEDWRPTETRMRTLPVPYGPVIISEELSQARWVRRHRGTRQQSRYF
jgi:hypothetical protein